MRRLSQIFGVVAACLTLAAQEYGPRQPDRWLDADTRDALLRALSDELRDNYLNPEIGQSLAERLERLSAFGTFDRVSSAGDLARKLTYDLRAVSRDSRLRVLYSFSPLPDAEGDRPIGAGGDGWNNARWSNHGVQSVQLLSGNIGYINLRSFAAGPEAAKAISAAVSLTEDTKVLVLDLRENMGGSREAMLQRAGCFAGSAEGSGGAAAKYQGGHVFVLVGPATPVIARRFAALLQTGRGATVVGSADEWESDQLDEVRLDDHFILQFPSRKRRKPDEEQLNIDRVVVGGDVFNATHYMAMEWLLAHTDDPEEQAILDGLIEQAPTGFQLKNEDRPGGRRARERKTLIRRD